MNQRKLEQLLPVITAITMLTAIPYIIVDVHAQNDFVAITEDNIKNNPMLAKILENIEKSKKEFSDVQQKTEQEKLIDKQRETAKKILDQELQQMFKDNEDFTPLSAFSKFLKTVPDDNTKTIFKGLFDYHQQKVDDARSALRDVLVSGGSLQDARNAYYEAAKIPRTEMVKLVKDLNIDTGFSDPEIQSHFDDNGKLPRFEDEEDSIVSFVDLTSYSKNVNSSDIQEKTEDTKTQNAVNSQDKTKDNNDVELNSSQNNTNSSENTIIQRLLDEIQKLKDKIKELQETQNSNLQNVIFEKQDIGSIHYADWVSDYSKGFGKYNRHILAEYTSPVNVLNAPNSYQDLKNSLSLGRQGQVTIGFSNLVTGNLILFETSSETDILEVATVEVSPDGEDWTLLEKTQYQNDNSYVDKYIYDLHDVGCISHVRITDVSTSERVDGLEIDALGATKLCTDST